MKAFIGVMIVIAFVASTAYGATRYVGPGETYTTIQSAIDAASGGDAIIVRDGTYSGTGNRDIDFNGRAIHLKSESGPETCVIDCQGSEAEPHRGCVFLSGEDENSVLEGFTITNGCEPDNYPGGGAILCASSSPVIKANIITGNTASVGGGICCRSSSAIMTGNVIVANGISGRIFCGSGWCSALALGGGIYCEEGSPSILNNVIARNRAAICFDYLLTSATADGGGIYCRGSSVAIINNTITGNGWASEAGIQWTGGGVCCMDSTLTIRNCIFCNNRADSGPEMSLGWYRSVIPPAPPSVATVSYSNLACSVASIHVDDGCTLNWDEGNIDTDPFFADPANDDYHVESRYGRWNPAMGGDAGAWAFDDVTSPCIDAGYPGSPYAGEPQPNGGRVNMGAYANTTHASRSGPWWPVSGDANHDCRVNLLDLLFIRDRLGQPVTTGDNWKADVNSDGGINLLDLLYVRDRLNSRCQ